MGSLLPSAVLQAAFEFRGICTSIPLQSCPNAARIPSQLNELMSCTCVVLGCSYQTSTRSTGYKKP